MKKLLLKIILSSFFFNVLSSYAQVPVANFGASRFVIQQYEYIDLFDSSSNSPFAWEWNIIDSSTYANKGFYPSLSSGDIQADPLNNGKNEFSKNPEFSFDVPGKYTVMMRSKNSSGWSNWVVKSKYIKVSLPTTYYLGYGTYGPNSDNIVDSEEGSIYDDGGPNLSYGNNQGYSTRSYLTIQPCKVKSITLTMSQLKFSSTNDVLRVYDGTKEDYSKLLASWTKNSTGNKVVTAQSGKMFVLFISDASGTDSGFIGTYTSVLDTSTTSVTPDFASDSIYYPAVPIQFNNTSTGISGVPSITWSIDGNSVPNNSKNNFKYTFYTNGTYSVCLDIYSCLGNYQKCKNITIQDPLGPLQLNFKASETYVSNIDPVYLIPESNCANRFYWTISPNSYTLMNPPQSPSNYGNGYINYNATPGDSFPIPKIKFLDTVCYTIQLKAYNSLIPSLKDSIIKTDYICGKEFSKVYPLHGTVFSDKDNNCMVSTGDVKVNSVPIRLYDTANNFISLTYSFEKGQFGFKAGPGKYKIVADVKGLPLTVSCPTGNDTIVTLDSNNSFKGVDFAVSCNAFTPDLKIQSISPVGKVFPGQIHKVRIVAGFSNSWLSLNCNPNKSGILRFSYTGKVTYQGIPNGSNTPYSISGNMITYQVANFNMVNYNDFQVYFKTDTNAVSNDTIVIFAEILPTTNDADTLNNRRRFVLKVGNSYDPNMKEVYPIEVKPNYSDWLTYTIHFQNTGTAPAYNIRLQDTLDANLIPETFEITDVSHAMRLDQRGRYLKFYFDDIMLPDSFTNSKGSQGFVQYRIKPVNGIPDKIIVKNTAYIFFDYNSPVVTNTAITEYKEAKSSIPILSNIGLQIYPNPGAGIFTISFNGSHAINLEVYNTAGQKVYSKDMVKSMESIDISSLDSGIYILRISSGEYTYYIKLLKY